MCQSHQQSPKNCHCRGGLLRGFVQPRLLLQLASQPAHGYELMEKLNRTGSMASSDPGNLYRMLRSLEENGLVRSNWHTGGPGPARRQYELTEKGAEHLDVWAENLRVARQMLDDFLDEYENCVSPGGKNNPARSGNHLEPARGCSKNVHKAAAHG